MAEGFAQDAIVILQAGRTQGTLSEPLTQIALDDLWRQPGKGNLPQVWSDMDANNVVVVPKGRRRELTFSIVLEPLFEEVSQARRGDSTPRLDLSKQLRQVCFRLVLGSYVRTTCRLSSSSAGLCRDRGPPPNCSSAFGFAHAICITSALDRVRGGSGPLV